MLNQSSESIGEIISDAYSKNETRRWRKKLLANKKTNAPCMVKRNPRFLFEFKQCVATFAIRVFFGKPNGVPLAFEAHSKRKRFIAVCANTFYGIR